MRRLASTFLGLSTFIILGCTRPVTEPDLSAILNERVEPSPSDEAEPLEFDFGSVLARDQSLHHEFRLANRSDRPLRLLGSRVKVPCCSGLGMVPESIAPGGEVIVPAFLKAGHVADRKRVTFEIKTDSPSRAIRTLIVAARLVPEWEVEELSGDPAAVKIGESSRKTYRVIARRKAGEGLRAPTEVKAFGALELESASLSAEVENSDGVIESFRVVVAKLPGQSSPGEKIGSLTFGWPDGSCRVHEVRWAVKPSLQLIPPALVLKPESGPTEVSIEVRSNGTTFRVLKVSGNLVAADVLPSGRPSTTQSFQIRLDPGRVMIGVKPVIEVVTDHPSQPTLTLGVLVLPVDKGRSE